jgi:16S rRNA (cytosine1402-N4)-methyltransferase
MGSLPVDRMEGPYSARLPSSSIGEKSRRAPVGRRTADELGAVTYQVGEEPSHGDAMSGNSAPAAFDHEPVMLAEVLEVFEPVPSGVFLDATVGGGGHSGALLASRGDIRLIGLDRDEAALDAAAIALAEFGDRVQLRRARFDSLDSVLDELKCETLVGVLFDLGVSSPQFDHGDRGFSYRNDGPLDMRMDRRQTLTAGEIVNEWPQSDLEHLISRYGEERHARRIAASIVAARPLESTKALAEVVRDAIPAPARRRGGHPAKRTFQALRIGVNGELDVLTPALEQAIERLEPMGRGAVLSYHSGEDRIVKQTLREAESGGCSCPPTLPCVCGAVPLVRLLKRGARRPNNIEQERNRRSSSALLRSFERLEPAA